VLTHHSYDLGPVFDVVVGTPPLAHLFTVNANVITERSRFFREAYKPKCLTGDLPKVLVLADEHPDVFQAYLNCVNRGPDALKGCGDGVVRELQTREKSEATSNVMVTSSFMRDRSRFQKEWFVREFQEFGELQVHNVYVGAFFVRAHLEFTTAESGAKAIKSRHHQKVDGCALSVEICMDPRNKAWEALLAELVDEGYTELIKLYLLADRLRDLETVNMIVDEIIDYRDVVTKLTYGRVTSVNPGGGPTTIAYASTKEGNPLRELLRDFAVTISRRPELKRLQKTGYPIEFFQDVALEKLGERLQGEPIPNDAKRRFYTKCHFHQHDLEHPIGPRCHHEFKLGETCYFLSW
jgi:hypothetical protein